MESLLPETSVRGSIDLIDRWDQEGKRFQRVVWASERGVS